MRKNNLLLRLFVLAVFVIVAPACAIKTNIPANRFQSPEARGETWHGSVHLALHGATEITLVSDYSRQPPITTAPEVDRGGLITLGVDLGLLERLDLSVQTPIDAPITVGAKYQLLGTPEEEAAAGNISLAVTGSIGVHGETGESKNAMTSVDSKYEMDAALFDTALIMGYRLDEYVLFYGGPFIAAYSANGEITQPASSSTKFKFEGSGSQYGANLGVRFHFGGFLLMVEEAWVNASYETQKQVGFYTGILGGFKW